MSTPVIAYIGLGSNLASPIQQLQQAFHELGQIDHTQLIKQSPLYRSKPHGPQDQPDFINAVAQIHTSLDAHTLLDALQTIEQDHQRTRERHWGPRTLDLDLLLYGNETITSERLTVPHTFLTQRNFVLYPLANLDDKFILPDGQTLQSLLQCCSGDGLELIDFAGNN